MKKVFQKRYVLLLVLFSQVLAVMFGRKPLKGK